VRLCWLLQCFGRVSGEVWTVLNSCGVGLCGCWVAGVVLCGGRGAVEGAFFSSSYVFTRFRPGNE
jgi:hypothetical protein